LVNRYGGASAALEALPELVARSLKGRAIRIADRDEALREIEASRAMGARFIVTSDPEYPPLLRMIDSAPPLLTIRGDAGAFARPCVAIVGSRNASASGLAFTERLARGLAREDYVVVSGLARGVDTAAHRVCVETGTVAVLAGGHARPYPSENAPLLEKIARSGGAVISEMPLEWEPRGRDFPRRNRLVSGLALGTVVIEAARRSGSLITARFAAEQGREVFAVPGSPQDPRAEGTNDLLREGATLCACVEDVTRALQTRRKGPLPGEDLFGESAPSVEEEPLFDELDLFSFREAPAPPPRAAPAEARFVSALAVPRTASSEAPAASARDLVLSLLSPAPVAVDELIRAVGLPAHDVQTALLDLDLEGRLERHGAALVSLLVEKPGA
jgi:DNA processing protein